MLFTPFFMPYLLCGGVFILAGFLLKRFPPKNINNWYGYRTAASMKSKARWDFAQVYAGKMMIGLGLLYGALGGLSAWLFPTFTLTSIAEPAIFIGVLLTGVVLLFLKVERAIKHRY